MEFVRVGSVVAGRRLDDVIGRGGMGVVYRATHLDLGRHEALKLISPTFTSDSQFRERFKRESRMAASIDHPNIVTIYDAGESEDQLYLSMELVRGQSLGQMIAERGRLDLEVTVEVVSQVASALDAAHDRGMVHRDVKPANLLIETSTESLRAYLADFGLTRNVASANAITESGRWIGSLDYVPPEQVRGRRVDRRADVYALGAVVFQSLSGQVPYPRDDDVAKMWAHINEPPPPLADRAPGSDQGVSAAVERAMAKRASDRFGTAGEFAEALKLAAGIRRRAAVASGSETTVVADAAVTAAADRGRLVLDLAPERASGGAPTSRTTLRPDPPPAPASAAVARADGWLSVPAAAARPVSSPAFPAARRPGMVWIALALGILGPLLAFLLGAISAGLVDGGNGSWLPFGDSGSAAAVGFFVIFASVGLFLATLTAVIASGQKREIDADVTLRGRGLAQAGLVLGLIGVAFFGAMTLLAIVVTVAYALDPA